MRKPRLIKKNATYHVTARANRSEFIYEQDEIKQLFLDVMSLAKKKYNFVLKNFCIMSNHVHIMIQPTKKSSLSKIMQWILSVFAIRFNKFFKLKGHVFYDRFHSVIIESLMQFLHTFNYITENPVEANLVKSPFEYTFNGVNYFKEGDYALLDPPWLYDEFRR